MHILFRTFRNNGNLINFLILLSLGLFFSVVWYRNYEISQIDSSQTLTFMNMFRDNSLYSDTFLLKKAYNFHFHSLYYIIAALLGTFFNPYWALYCYFIFINCLNVFSLFILAKTITNNTISAFFSIFVLIFQWQLGFSLGGTTPLGVGPYADQLAMPFLFIALAYHFRDKSLLSYILTGLAFNFHGSFAVFLYLIITADLLMRKRYIAVLKGTFSVLIVASPLIVLILNHPLPSVKINFEDWYHLIRIRVAGHTMPSLWPFGTWAKFLPYLFLFPIVYRFWVRYFRMTSGVNIANSIRNIIAAIFLLCLFGYMFAEILPIASIIKLTPYRSTKYFVALVSILFCGMVVHKIQYDGGWKKYLYCLMAVAFTFASFPLMYFTLLIYYLNSIRLRNSFWALISSGTLVALCLFSIHIYGLSMIWGRSNMILSSAAFVFLSVAIFHSRFLQAKYISLICVALLTLICLIPLNFYNYFAPYKNDNYYAASRDVQEWLSKNSNYGDIAIIPPYAGVWSGISKRGYYFNYNDLNYPIYSTWLYPEIIIRSREYIDNLKNINNENDLLGTMNQSYSLWDEKKFVDIASRWNCRYAIVDSSKHYNFPKVYHNKSFNVYEIR